MICLGLQQYSLDPLVARDLLKIITLIDFCFARYSPYDFTSGGDVYTVMLFFCLVIMWENDIYNRYAWIPKRGKIFMLVWYMDDDF